MACEITMPSESSESKAAAMLLNMFYMKLEHLHKFVSLRLLTTYAFFFNLPEAMIQKYTERWSLIFEPIVVQTADKLN